MNIALKNIEVPHFAVPYSKDLKLNLDGTKIITCVNSYRRTYTIYVSAHLTKDGRIAPYMYSEGYDTPRGWSVIKNEKELKAFYESL